MQSTLSPASASPNARQSYTLAHTVSAIQIFSSASQDRSKLGLITQLPEGARVDVGGPGFDDRTVKVRCGNAQYYVFIEDILPPRKLMASVSMG